MKGLEKYRRFVFWGCRSSLHSHRHIWRHYRDALRRLGYQTAWFEDLAANRNELDWGDLVFAFDVEGEELGTPLPGVDYVLHNIPPDHPVRDGLGDSNYIYLQVYTSDCEQWGESWGPARRFDGRTLFGPWGTDLFAEEFYEPAFNPASREACFVGAVWDDGGLGNQPMIRDLEATLAGKGIALRKLTHVTDAQNLQAVRQARLAPALAGRWQVEHNYLPCRAFKNSSYGALIVCNVPKINELYDGCNLGAGSVGELVDRALALRAPQYTQLVREQQQVTATFTYREGLACIGRAFEAIRA